ncbi:hypothetical protein BKA70DRAFT_1366497 [Coprinopsis sp. MPI-PUGE-AT-0042]|nr:hypothetical protein BKA70DRAFT_1366497 [Coprinopsis sp. MPI-PUGE-AT-0042]
MSSSDPRKPRAPKAYTEPQMAFLKSHLEEFEKRSAGPVRGDAKKYALEQAQGFVVRFGLPPEFQPLEEGETRFKEQIYNWFKNTIGRKRRQAEGKPRSMPLATAAGPSGSGASLSPTLQWNVPQQQQQSQASSLAAFAGHNVAESSSSSPALGTIQQPQAISLGQIHYGLHTPQQTPQHVHSNTPPVPGPSHTTHHQQHQHQQQHQHHHHHSSHHSPHEQQHLNSIHPLPAPTPIRVAQGQQQQQQPQQQPQQQLSQHTHVNQETLRDAFLSPSVEIFISSSPPSLTPLTLVVEVLFGAGSNQSGYSRDPTPLVQRFCDASRYWGTSIVHCNLTGVEAAGRALMGLIRRWSVWQPLPPLSSLHGGLGGMSAAGYGPGKMASPSLAAHAAPASGSSSLSEDMQRIAAERQRRKDHIQWARIHAAALEVGLVGTPAATSLQIQSSNGAAGGGDSTQSYGRYIAERAFSEMVARDAVWEEDEAEWVAGLYVLRGLIRSAVRGNKPFGSGVERRQREEYWEMLRVYEGRWKEIKDEVRQSLATDVLFSAKEELESMAS